MERERAMSMCRGFFAYPSDPAFIPETVETAIRALNDRAPVEIASWEDCRVGGKVILEEIVRAIDASALFLADVTGINPNVMFELGYAIARNKRVWIILDGTLPEAKRDYERVQVLTTVGYAGYSNSEDIVGRFLGECPFSDLDATIFARSIGPTLEGGRRYSLLYLRNRHDTEASRRLSREVDVLQRAGVSCIVDDPSEARVQPLSWYGQKVYSALAVLVHLCGEHREGARLHNARYALVAGLAYGLEKALLMLAEADYEVPLDYQDLLVSYAGPRKCVEGARPWLDRVRSLQWEERRERSARVRAVELATELSELRLGEYVAEQEVAELDTYFVETSAYREALEGRHTVFVGRKGSGKTANLLRMSSALGKDRRNLVCVVKPVGYNLDGIVRLLGRYRERDTKGYLVECLWKFLLYSEVARAVTEVVESRPARGPGDSAEGRLLELMDQHEGLLREDFAVRLERCLESLEQVAEPERIQDARLAISETLHAGLLRDLRAVLGEVLERRRRVAVLVDNLDKAWVRRDDLPHLTELLLGLLSAARRIPGEFQRADRWRRRVELTLTVFLRSDIFHRVRDGAREPDKISYSRLVWDDPEVLLRVIEERFVTSRGGGSDPAELWKRFFCPTVGAVPARQYLVTRVLPRPRDLLYLCRAAVAQAVNRRHSRVEESDILQAEKAYSQYALDTIQVEDGVNLPELEGVLYEFVGVSEEVDEIQVRELLRRAGIEEHRHEVVTRHLCALSFLGAEVREGSFAFACDEDELRKQAVMARRLVETRGGPRRYRVNAAFHTYLEVEPV